MTTTPELYPFRPLNHDALTITGITDLTPEQVTAVTAPFATTLKPAPVFTAQSFSVTCDLSGVTLPDAYRLRCWIWVKGSASSLAPISYNPSPPVFLKSNLWRLLGGESEGSSSVTVALPSALPVCRVQVEVRALFDLEALYVPLEP